MKMIGWSFKDVKISGGFEATYYKQSQWMLIESLQ